MQRKPKKENFELKEVKSLDRVSLDFSAVVSVADGTDTYKINLKDTYSFVPHPDLLRLLDQLKIRLFDYHGYCLFSKMVNESKFKASAAQKKYAFELDQRIKNQIKVNGISITGKGRNGIIVKGSYSGSSINTKSLHFTNEEYGEELKEIADAIESEVYEYIFEGKRAQLEIFGGESPEDVIDGKAKASGDD